MGSFSSKKKGGTDTRSSSDTALAPIIAGTASSFKPNEIRELEVDEDFSILVSEYEGKFYAYGSRCPHYGAPLHSGVLVDGLIRCPWHGACFDIRTGDIEDHPGMACIPTYKTSRGHSGNILVHPENIGVTKIHRPLSKSTNPGKLMVVLGGGAAGLIFAKTLREQEYDGRILIISNDSHLPYDRTKLSKFPGISWEEVKLRSEEWYEYADLEIMLNTTVRFVNLGKKQVYVEGQNKPIVYDQLLIATGLRPRLPALAGEEMGSKQGATAGIVEGINFRNVLTLHSLKDSARIMEKTRGKTVVIFGAGFIGMELASSLQSHCESITILSRNPRPYGTILGESVGRMIQQRIIRKHPNIKFFGCEDIRKIQGDKVRKRVTGIVTLKGREIRCDVVIFAIGGIPCTDFLLNAYDTVEFGKAARKLPLNMSHEGYIPVNEYMKTADPNVWAAGDVARIPLNSVVAHQASVGHWGIAQKMGRLAALNVMGQTESIVDTIPFFWTQVAGISIRYVGFGENFNKSFIFGDLQDLRFCVVYRRESRIVAVCTANCDPIAAKVAFDMQDDVDWGERFPDYITEAFLHAPLVGESHAGIRFDDMEDSVVDYDSHTIRLKDLWVERHPKVFNSKHQHRDLEYRVVIPKSVMEQSNLIFKSHFNQSKINKDRERQIRQDKLWAEKKSSSKGNRKSQMMSRKSIKAVSSRPQTTNNPDEHLAQAIQRRNSKAQLDLSMRKSIAAINAAVVSMSKERIASANQESN
jgi:NADPH-dependent 2,4-dienoyl-CoA reductase/sulfur reductase-like enzyme/nitrite reductase/ring-hydroxylating ferredoxin subunit